MFFSTSRLDKLNSRRFGYGDWGGDMKYGIPAPRAPHPTPHPALGTSHPLLNFLLYPRNSPLQFGIGFAYRIFIILTFLSKSVFVFECHTNTWKR